MNLIRFSVLLLLAAVSARAATLSGTVRDSQGAVIAGAHVVVHWDPSGSNYLKDNIGIKQDIVATTDSNGRFSVDLRLLRCTCDRDGFYTSLRQSSRERERAKNIRS